MSAKIRFENNLKIEIKSLSHYNLKDNEKLLKFVDNEDEYSISQIPILKITIRERLEKIEVLQEQLQDSENGLRDHENPIHKEPVKNTKKQRIVYTTKTKTIVIQH